MQTREENACKRQAREMKEGALDGRMAYPTEVGT